MMKIVELPGSGIEDLHLYVEKIVLEKGYFEHLHNFIEINLIVRGTATQTINGNPLPVKAGDVFVLNPKVSHGFMDADRLTLYQAMYNPDIIAAGLPALKRMSGYQGLFILEPSMIGSVPPFHNFTSLAMSDLETAVMMFEQMIREFNGREEGFEALLPANLARLIVFLSRRYSISKRGSSDPAHRTARAAAYIERNYLSPLSLAQLAAYVNVSVSQLIRDFKKSYGTTPIDYTMHLRIEHAIALLQNRNLSLTEIAFSSGFTDGNYFTRIFRQRTGFTPGRYRNRM